MIRLEMDGFLGNKFEFMTIVVNFRYGESQFFIGSDRIVELY